MVTFLLLLFMAVSASWAVRGEHRVHNIILNPEKYSRCQTTKIQQVVASPGYEPVTIFNNVCVGWCYSYSIPSTQPAEPGEVIGPYCDSCQPIETKCYHVALKSDSTSPDSAPTFQKRVQLIRKCSCMTCEKLPHDDCESPQPTTELPLELYANQTTELPPVGGNRSQEEVPELLHLPHHQKPPLINFDITESSNDQKFELNSKLLNLLKNIQNEEDANYDKSQLKELLKIIEGSDNELSDKNLMEFVNFVNIHNNEDLEVDLGKLKDVLIGFQKHQNLLEKHRDFGLVQNQKNNLKIEQDLKKFHLSEEFGLEEATAHHKHTHHVGDEIHVSGLNVGHLVKGPHGSLVLAPDLKVEEKLNIDSDVLKPNHDGVVIEYKSPRKSNGILTD